MNLASRYNYVKRHVIKLGLSKTLEYFLKRIVTPKENLFAINLKGLEHKVFLRSKTYDIHIFYQIFIEEELLLKADKKKCIVDLGANIGLSTLFLKRMFPDAFIYCLEPFQENYSLLKKNVEAYSNIKILNKAIYKDNGSHYLVDIGEGYASYRILAEPAFEVISKIDCITMNELIQFHKIESIDILKIDIEGSEKSILLEATDLEWINRVNFIMVEIHDHMYNNLRQDILNVLSVSFEYEESGEYTIFRKKS